MFLYHCPYRWQHLEKDIVLNCSFVFDALKAVWDALKPRSCDTHSTSYSATRETFLKLLRPGVDYREAFHKVTRRGTGVARGLRVARAGMVVSGCWRAGWSSIGLGRHIALCRGRVIRMYPILPYFGFARDTTARQREGSKTNIG